MTLQEAAARLAAAGIDEPMREARILLAGAPDRFEDAISRREKHEPVAYILRRKEFWSLDFEVSPAVLIPRPDSETLVETALKELKHNPPRRILDLGTGTGCLIIALLSEWRNATAIAVDKSPAALDVAMRNATRHTVADRIDFRCNDWTNGISERFDLVISNPPYISEDVLASIDASVRDFEPHLALNGGKDGLEPLARIAKALREVLAPSALAIVEIGYDQGQSASRVFTSKGLKMCRIVKDLAGNDRVIVATLPQ